nr:NADH dehydrogenase subunit 6 [Stenochironomus sp. 3CZ]
MVQKFFFILILISSFMFIFLNHPLSMNTNLMIQAFLITIFSGLLIKSFWFSYSLFLIFLGGMLILFMYMTMVASNEKFWTKKIKYLKFYLILILMLIILTIMFFWFNYYFLMNKIFNMESLKFNYIMSTWDINLLMLNKIYNYPMNLLSIFLMLILFLTLIASVKITNSNYSSMRMKMNK